MSGASASYEPPPGDVGATWLTGGNRLFYETQRRPGGLRILNLPEKTEHVSPIAGPPSSLVVSPDGAWVAGIVSAGAGADARTELVAQRFDGTDRHVLSTSNPLGGFAWSPDSADLAFVAAGTLSIVRADGTGLRTVPTNAGPIGAAHLYGVAAWSADGSRLALTESDSAGGHLAVVGVGGSGLRAVAPPMESSTWSPDGRAIAGIRFVNNHWEIDVVDVASGAIRGYPGTYPLSFQQPDVVSWAADSSALIYSRHLTDPSQAYGTAPVYRIDVASGAQTVVVSGGFDAHYSPDGSRVVFAAFGSCETAGNYLMPATGGPAVRITNDCESAPNLAVKLDAARFTYGNGTLLEGTAPAAPTIRFSGACGENTPVTRPLSAGGWSYGFVPCRNGTVTVTATSKTHPPTGRRHHAQLRRFSPIDATPAREEPL